MVYYCEFCRAMVASHLGYLVRHGVRDHGKFILCSGSGVRVCSLEASCCD